MKGESYYAQWYGLNPSHSSDKVQEMFYAADEEIESLRRSLRFLEANLKMLTEEVDRQENIIEGLKAQLYGDMCE